MEDKEEKLKVMEEEEKPLLLEEYLDYQNIEINV